MAIVTGEKWKIIADDIIRYCLETVKPANDASPEVMIERKLITTLVIMIACLLMYSIIVGFRF